MKQLIGIFLVLLMLTIGTASAKGPASGSGSVMVGTDVSVWDSDFGIPSALSVPLAPIGGSGQVNGGFTIAERNGIQIGLRAQERRVGPVEPIPNNNGKVGVYEVKTGKDLNAPPTTLAWWNYDWHVDLRGATGQYAGKTLADYDLTLDTDIVTGPLFGMDIPIDLKFPLVTPPAVFDVMVLYQSSQNPEFGNMEFDQDAEETYHFRLVLTPKTFNGPPLAVAIQVNATTP